MDGYETQFNRFAEYYGKDYPIWMVVFVFNGWVKRHRTCVPDIKITPFWPCC